MYIPIWEFSGIYLFGNELWTQPHIKNLQGNVETLTLLTQVADGGQPSPTCDGQFLNSHVPVYYNNDDQTRTIFSHKFYMDLPYTIYKR